MHSKTASAILDHVAVSNEFTGRLVEELNTHRAAQKRAADLRPEVLQQLVEAGCVSANNKQAADAMLGSHAETLSLLSDATRKLAELAEQNAKLAAAKGHSKSAADAAGGNSVQHPAVAPQGSGRTYDSLTDPVIGRRTSEKKASDIAFEEVMRGQRRVGRTSST